MHMSAHHPTLGLLNHAPWRVGTGVLGVALAGVAAGWLLPRDR
jgi:hypothetical protein